MTPERYRRICETLDRRQPDLTVIMDGVHKPHNIAAIVRTCDAVGILDVHAILPNNRARMAAGTAMGSQRWVKVHKHEESTSVIRELQGQGVQVLAAHLSDTAVPYREVDYSKPTALLLGTEKFGVSDEAAAAVDQHVIIPMMGMVESFNVSVAAAIVLSEACEQRRAKGLYDQPRLDAQRYQQLLFRWGHARIARLCDAHGVPYPELDEEGQVKDSAALTALLQKSE
ncbi:tRNA (guanosine(18)-2'-O)-methyltransferase TrmH [Alcanivorax sp. DP30]|uniref:tRNA (guanosine(18)-2'-O)-methyltransferase TrmH n=1 Tax=Alcanivorax sp. DP30 TaxID=2606217 RepID=UPI001371D343|nr:tRNA (guanosine(18)-2'-O)-methyltransferase TrmH [Alcanivorax sp. DP30]MZR63971.1 tRNA (guanosine(18)-2'-O)-methyltransferase TrmH [Alcanivorax sp. DP30]